MTARSSILALVLIGPGCSPDIRLQSTMSECLEPAQPASCDELCAELDQTCDERGCGGGYTRELYPDLAACEVREGQSSETVSCEEPADSPVRCCCR